MKIKFTVLKNYKNIQRFKLIKKEKSILDIFASFLKKLKLAFFLFLFFNLSFSLYEPVEILVEKSWVIENTEGVRSIYVESPFLLNTSQQKVLYLETNFENISTGKNILLRTEIKNPNGEKITLYAKAIVLVNYSPFFNDYIIPESTFLFQPSNNIIYNEEIRNLAYSLKKDKVVKTALNINNWIYKNFQYDLSFEEKNLNASEIIKIKRGVCSHYAKAMVSLLRAIGIRANYISGYYLENNKTEPHAWVEVELNNKTIYFDPTHGEAVLLSSLRVALYSSNNESEGYDYYEYSFLGFNTPSSEPLYKTEFKMSILKNYSTDLKEIKVDFIFLKNESKIIYRIENPTDKYVVFPYYLLTPLEEPKKELLFIPPYSSTFVCKVMQIEPYYIYPITLIIGDYKFSTNVSIFTPSSSYIPINDKEREQIEKCFSSLFLEEKINNNISDYYEVIIDGDNESQDNLTQKTEENKVEEETNNTYSDFDEVSKLENNQSLQQHLNEKGEKIEGCTLPLFILFFSLLLIYARS